MRRNVEKKVALIAGLGVMVVLGMGAVSWQSLAVQYHLYRLRAEPGYLFQIIDNPEGTVAKKAVHDFLKTTAGAQKLISALMLDYESAYANFTTASKVGWAG